MDSQLRIVAGAVNADGSIKSGQDFTAARTSEGHFVVSFRPAFAQISGGSATQIYGDSDGGDPRDNAVIVWMNASQVLIKTGDSRGAFADREFTFIFAGVGELPARLD